MAVTIGGVHVAQGGGGDAAGEGGGVGAVLGVEQEVEVHGGDGVGVGLFAVDHVEEVGGVGEVLSGGDGLEAVSDAVMGGDDGGCDGRQPLGLAYVGGLGHVLGVGVEGGEGADGGAQDVHGVGLLHDLDDVDDAGRQGAVAGRRFLKASSLLRWGGRRAGGGKRLLRRMELAARSWML